MHCRILRIATLTLFALAGTLPAARAATLGCAANGLTPEPEEFYAQLAEDNMLGGETWRIVIGDPLIIGVGSKGGKALWACQPDGIFEQYFAYSSFGSVLSFWDGDYFVQYGSPYYSLTWTPGAEAATFGEGAIHEKTVEGDVTKVTSDFSLGDHATLRQIITYRAGGYGFSTRLELRNVFGEELSDARFFHGGDTYFGFDDFSRSWRDEASGVIYIANDVFDVSGLMTFQAGGLTPPDHWFAGFYYDGRQYILADARLPDTTDAEYVDMSYSYEWNREAFADGALWVMEVTEQVSDPTFFAVIPPPDINSVNNHVETLRFVVHNLDQPPAGTGDPDEYYAHEIGLSAVCDRGWETTVVGVDTLTLGSLERATVEVEVRVPSDAAPGMVGTVTLTAADAEDAEATGVGSASVTLRENRYTLTRERTAFSLTSRGDRDEKKVTLRNTDESEALLVGQVGGTDALAAPFSIRSDECSNREIPPGESCVVTLRFAPVEDGEFTDTFNFPILAPYSQNWNMTVAGSAGGRYYDEKINYGCFLDTLER